MAETGTGMTRRRATAAALGGATGGAMLLALGACGPAGAGTPPAKEAAPVRFSFWNARAFDLMEQHMIEVYREKNPNVTVEYVPAADRGVTGSDAEQVNGLIIRATAGGTIDIAKVEASRMPFALWARKAILSLKKFGGDKLASTLLNPTLMNFAGDTWSLSYEASVRGLMYNGSMFRTAGLDPDRPPQTWEEVVSMGQRLAAPPERFAYTYPINNLFKTLDQIWMNGGDIFDRQYLPTKATFTRREVQEVYQFQYDLVHKYGIAPDKAISNAALSGAEAMEYGDASSTPAFRAKQPEADWRVVKMFRQKAQSDCFVSAAGSGLVLFNASAAPEAAYQYMAWLVGDEAQRIHSLITPGGLTMDQIGTTGIFPGNKRVAADPYWDTNPLVKGMNNCVTGIRAAATSPVFTEINTMLSDMQVQILAKKVSVPDALADAQRQGQALLDNDVKSNPDLYATAR
ncbi:MAG TPA: extracellular solute-binding protein [Chloroflexota bacterium]|nr:extracellular solute-binding protein [Chloroflexota bacterium]